MYHLDTTPGAVYLATDATIDIPNFSGIVMVGHTGGTTSVYLCGGGHCTNIGNSYTTSAGTMSYVGAGGGYRFTAGSTSTYAFCIIRLRSTA